MSDPMQYSLNAERQDPSQSLLHNLSNKCAKNGSLSLALLIGLALTVILLVAYYNNWYGIKDKRTKFSQKSNPPVATETDRLIQNINSNGFGGNPGS